MAGPFPLGAEISGGGHESGAEEDLPKTVYGDAGRQRLAGHGDPAGEAQPVRGGAAGQCRETGEGARGDLFGGLGIIAAIEDKSVAGFFRRIHHHGGKGLGEHREAFLQIGEGDPAGLQFRGGGRAVLPEGS